MTNATIKTSRKRPFNWAVFQLQAAPYVFISPFFIIFAIFSVFPLFFSLYLSFQDWDIASGLNTMKPTGVSNFTFTWTDPEFWKALRNTFYIAILSGVPQHLIAIPTAYVLHTLVKRGRHFFSAALFVPFVTSTVAVALILTVLFSERNGIVNQVLLAMRDWPLMGWLPDKDHLIRWVWDQKYLPILISLLVVWKYTGYNVLFYMAGLQTISPDIYEAAEIDGATKLHQFWYITLPLLRPIAFYTITLTLIGNLNLFEEPFILASGSNYGQNQSGMTMGAYLYKAAFTQGFPAQASAASWMFFVVVMVLTLLNNKIFSGGREK
jgi:multiple sugar transport system permease protein